MAAATITTQYPVGMLVEENVLLECSDGETYVSRLSRPVVAYATAQADNDGEINCTLSGRTITVNAAGMTDVAIALCIKGYL